MGESQIITDFLFSFCYTRPLPRIPFLTLHLSFALCQMKMSLLSLNCQKCYIPVLLRYDSYIIIYYSIILSTKPFSSVCDAVKIVSRSHIFSISSYETFPYVLSTNICVNSVFNVSISLACI